MTKRVLIIGGYGNFGGIIATKLADDPNIQLWIGGRSIDKAKEFIAGLVAAVRPEPIEVDITGDLDEALHEAKPDIVIHTVGPFQLQGYAVVEACIRHGCHYIDLSDGREFVADIGHFDKEAKAQNVLAVSGASSVPCLTAAVIDRYREHFATVEKVEYGISAAQQAIQGLATVSGVLSYVGEPFYTLVNGKEKKIYGWQGLHAHRYPVLGWKLFGNCDIPDLELFPSRYPELRTIRFSAGAEISVVHLGLWFFSWVVRTHLMPPIESIAPLLLKMSRLFDIFGRKRSGFHMLMYGTGKNGEPKAEAFYMIAKSGHGVHIPCVPAILLAKGLASGAITTIGARPCLDMIDLKTYCDALKGLDISILRDVKITLQKPESKLAAKAEKKSAEAYSYKQDPTVPAFPDDRPLFVFDGICVLCSSGVRWFIEHGKGDLFYFASAQSPLGQALYRHYGMKLDDSYLLINQGVIYTKSDGYLHIAGILGGWWKSFKILNEIPRSARDALYDFVARRRYKWFGKVKQCELIPADYRENLLK